LLAELIRFRGWPDQRVILGPRLGEDAAVIDLGDRYLVAKTDPITFVTDDIGWYLVQVNANDLATSGAAPRWLLVTLLLPEHGATPELAQCIVSQIDAACRQLHIAVVGGHTEVTHGLDRPLAVGHMLGEVAKDKWVATSGARVGDDLLLVKGVAIEGTSIVAREKALELRKRGYSEEFIARAQKYLYDPGISVVREALMAVECAEVHAMHDPTEGGLATALHELVHAAGVGLWVDAQAIPILPECQALCIEFSLNPLGLIASGSLLVALPPEETPALLLAYREADITCSRIGHITPAGEGLKLENGTSTMDLPRFDQDEVARLF
jgi:hydrogenase expression/formation protein HypE